MTDTLTRTPSTQDRDDALRASIEADLKARALEKVYRVGILGTGFSVHPEHGYVSDVSAERARKQIQRFVDEHKKTHAGS